MVADPAYGQLNRKGVFFPVSVRSTENSVSQNRGSVVLSRGNQLILHIPRGIRADVDSSTKTEELTQKAIKGSPLKLWRQGLRSREVQLL